MLVPRPLAWILRVGLAEVLGGVAALAAAALGEPAPPIDAKAKAHLFKPPTGILWAGALSHSRSGHQLFAGQNPAFGSAVYYYLAENAKEATLEIRNARGDTIRRLRADKKAGLHATRYDHEWRQQSRQQWDARQSREWPQWEDCC